MVFMWIRCRVRLLEKKQPKCFCCNEHVYLTPECKDPIIVLVATLAQSQITSRGTVRLRRRESRGSWRSSRSDSHSGSRSSSRRSSRSSKWWSGNRSSRRRSGGPRYRRCRYQVRMEQRFMQTNLNHCKCTHDMLKVFNWEEGCRWYLLVTCTSPVAAAGATTCLAGSPSRSFGTVSRSLT